MNALLKLKEEMEIEFLKSKTYTEINEMFNELNDKLELARAELNGLRLDDVNQQSELLKALTEIKDCCDGTEHIYDVAEKALNAFYGG